MWCHGYSICSFTDEYSLCIFIYPPFCVKVHCIAQCVTLEWTWTKCIHITFHCVSIMAHCINNCINIKGRSSTTWQFRIKGKLFDWEWQIQISHIYFMLSAWSHYIHCLKKSNIYIKVRIISVIAAVGSLTLPYVWSSGGASTTSHIQHHQGLSHTPDIAAHGVHSVVE